jgi:ABC-type multidrug transport system fused ATPase/permease subunit
MMETSAPAFRVPLREDVPEAASSPGSQPRASARSLYAYIWETSRRQQIIICVLTMAISPLPMAYLELQRRIVDDALTSRNLHLLALLGVIYLGVISVKSGLKYALNMTKGMAVEHVARDIRKRVLTKASTRAGEDHTADITGATGFHAVGRNRGHEWICRRCLRRPAAQRRDNPLCRGLPPVGAAGDRRVGNPHLFPADPDRAVYAAQDQPPGSAAHPVDALSRHLATLRAHPRPSAQPIGWLYIDRLYRVRIWLYLRKFLISELGNFLASTGPLIVLTVGGYLVITGRTEVGTLVVFISGLQRISDPWDELVNFYRAVSNTTVLFAMIREKLSPARAAVAELVM